jgi:CRISPR-associated protein Cmr4
MFEKGMLVGLFSETSLHPGTGTTTGVVDLPIQRERHTGFPIIQSSGLKGAMREKAEKIYKGKLCDDKGNRLLNDGDVNIIFGPESTEHAGSIGITDARLLAFPVRSLSQVYVWVTCPIVLDRLKRDVDILNKTIPQPPVLSETLQVTDGTFLAVDDPGLGTKLVLEEHLLTLDKSKAADVKQWIDEIKKFMPGADNKGVYKAVREKMDKHLLIISDDDFTYLVKHATQVTARNVLNDKNKTSENLWYEESLPPDCLFYSIILVMNPRVDKDKNKSKIKTAEDVIANLKSTIKDYLQIGGNETIGMGWCAIQYVPESGGLQ